MPVTAHSGEGRRAVAEGPVLALGLDEVDDDVLPRHARLRREPIDDAGKERLLLFGGPAFRCRDLDEDDLVAMRDSQERTREANPMGGTCSVRT